MLCDLTGEGRWARDWLFQSALPLWWEKGADRQAGGWFDKLDQNAIPLDCPKRLRVQARQAFVYAEAGRLGWDGPWQDAYQHGIDYILSSFRLPNGLYRSSLPSGGMPGVDSPDLYDQAFVLFALAAGYKMMGRPMTLEIEARALLRRLVASLGHCRGGFEEANPRVLPLRSNPQMHLLEALLAWVDAGVSDVFEEAARSIVYLAREKLIDSATGAVGEYYDGDWNFSIDGGQIREPGHQFEWAYLLHLARNLLGEDFGIECARLCSFGMTHGTINGRVIAAVGPSGALIDGSSRLWSQTERLRTTIVLAEAANSQRLIFDDTCIRQAIETTRHFLDVPLRGLWMERMDQTGSFVDEAVPASSLYHIMTGLVPLIEAVPLGWHTASESLKLRLGR